MTSMSNQNVCADRRVSASWGFASCACDTVL